MTDGAPRGKAGSDTESDSGLGPTDGLSAGEERLGLAMSIGGLATWDWDLASGEVAWSDEHYRMEGYGVGEIEPSYEAWLARVHPEDREATVEALDRARAECGEYAHEFRSLHPDGSVRVLAARGRFFGADGAATRMIGVMRDVTAKRAAETALRDGERQLRVLVEGIPQLVWRAGSEGGWIWSSPQWSAFTGRSPEQSRGMGWLGAVHADDRDRMVALWAQAAERGTFEIEHRLCHHESGEYRWFQTRALPLYDDGGSGVAEWLGTSTDIDDIRRLRERQKLLLAELQHRVRNTLAIVRSIVSRTAEGSDDVESVSAHIEGRLDALARVQSAITRTSSGAVDLATLIEGELLAHALHEGERLSIQGPPASLERKTAETMSLAVHELTSNAVKYGALACSGGRIAVRWALRRREGRRWLDFNWTESQLDAPVGPPDREGFGTEVLLRNLPYELGAETVFDVLPTGLRFRCSLPLEPRGSPDPTAGYPP